MFIKNSAKWGMILLSLLLSTSLAVAATTHDKHILPIQHWKTSNGVQVYFVAAPELPIIDIAVVFNAGSARDKEQLGIAYLTSAMLSEGTAQLNADQLAADFENVGARFTTNVTRDMAIIGLRTMTDKHTSETALKTFIQALSAPAFPEEGLKRQQKQVLNILKEHQQSPGTIATEAFFKTVYKDHPYGHPIKGTENSVMGLTTQDLRRFYQQHYVAKNAVIALVGAMNAAQARGIAGEIAAELNEGQASAPIPPATPLQNLVKTQLIPYPSAQTHIDMGQVGITFQDPDYYSLYVGNYILGGGSLVSRLFNTVREQHGLAYVVNSSLQCASAKGPFLINMSTRNNQAKTALDLVKKTLVNFIDQGPSAQELIAAKQHIVGSFPTRLDSNNAILSMLLTIGYYHLPLDYLDTFRPRIDAVTIEQVHEAFKRHISADQLTVVMVGG